MDWRQKIENQRGAVLATELKNNANKLARWTSAALVASIDSIKLGYVARAHPRDRHHHVILSTQVRSRRLAAAPLISAAKQILRCQLASAWPVAPACHAPIWHWQHTQVQACWCAL